MMPLRSLFVDFDSYFASVEQDDNPNLRGQPVGVVPVMAETTCCIAASYEAKAYGVKTGTQVAQARRLCPNITLVLARHKRYIERHHQLIAAVERCIPVDEVASIDEMACSLTGSWQHPEKALAVAHGIQASVAQIAPHIGCSIGIGLNRFLAKTACMMGKPRGLTLLNDADIPHALLHLDIQALNGIGSRMRQRLNTCGINSVADLYAADAATLRRAWGGVGGEHMYANLRGQSFSQTQSNQKSIGHSHVLPPERRAPKHAYAVLHRLLQKAAWRLRNTGFETGGLTLHLRYLDRKNWHGKQPIAATADSLLLGQVLHRLWQQRPRPRASLLGVGVALIHLAETRSISGNLFEASTKRHCLNATIDALNTRFGKAAVYLGGAHGALDEAPMRIAFTQIPDPEIEG